MRYYQGSRIVFESLGKATPASAEDARKNKKKQLSVVKDAVEFGSKLVLVDPGRKLLSEELKKFLKDTADNGALEAADVYRLACDEFLLVIGRQYVDEVVHSDVTRFQVALQKRGMRARTVKNRHTSRNRNGLPGTHPVDGERLRGLFVSLPRIAEPQVLRVRDADWIVAAPETLLNRFRVLHQMLE